MDETGQPEEIGCWKKEKVLGTGGFGYVILWRNKENNETIALKQCRFGYDAIMTPKHRSRWKYEVDMMFRLDHPNVVKALNVPPELDVPATELPLLAMEYCSGGDLRKLLNKPENCCGLKEKYVRLFLRHISSAVNYLHSMRIIHRDLKPENIVIQDTNGSMVFKLIDLGYAKELDQGSLCVSFVGTLQYLAPELFMSQKYSCTVDYWSFGLVAHEIITGIRPFLPDKSPADWIPIIKQKESSHIRAYLDDDKNIIFSNEISPHHHICSVLKEDIETCLQILLEYDPKKRGRCNEQSAFIHLDKILDKKVLFIFCLHTFKMLSFSAENLSNVDELQECLQLMSGVPKSQQEILLSRGCLPAPEKGISQFLSNSEDEIGAFLFHKNEVQTCDIPSPTIPPVVEKIMRNPRTNVGYQDQRISWAQAVFLSQQHYVLLSRLIQAFRVSLIHLMMKTAHTRKTAAQMTSEMNKVLAKSSFLRKSLEQDLNSYRKQAENGGFTSQTMLDGWKNSFENLKKLDLLKQKVNSLEELSSSIDAQTMELQRTSYARSKQTNPLEDTHNKILEAFADLKKRSQDQRHILHDNTDIVRLLCLCLTQSRSSAQDIMLLIRTINKIKQEIEDIIPQILNILEEINDWDAQICSWQSKRQADLWKVMNAMCEKIRCLERLLSPLIQSGSPQTSKYTSSLGHPTFPRHNLDFSMWNKHDSILLKNMSPSVTAVPPINNHVELHANGSSNLTDHNDKMKSSIQSLGFASMSSLLGKTVDDANQIKKENESLYKSFQQMVDSLKNDKVLEENSEIDEYQSNGLKNEKQL